MHHSLGEFFLPKHLFSDQVGFLPFLILSLSYFTALCTDIANEVIKRKRNFIFRNTNIPPPNATTFDDVSVKDGGVSIVFHVTSQLYFKKLSRSNV